MKRLLTITTTLLLFLSFTNEALAGASCSDIKVNRITVSGKKQDIIADVCQHSYGGNGCGIVTAIGCVPAESGPLGVYLLTWAFGFAGGIAFLFLAYGGFLLITSSGDPKKVQSGKEIIMAALSGLLFLIFSMFILRLVGVQVFQIPGFG